MKNDEIKTPHGTAVANSTLSTLHSKLKINQWAEEDRPREKMMAIGSEALSNAELLAILIGSGSTKESAVDLMKRLLNDCNNNLNTLGKKTIHELCQYNGIGEAKAISILAACELGKRRQAESPEERPKLETATRIYNEMIAQMKDLDVEEFWALYLNTIMAVCHNHPSGSLTPSRADNELTRGIQRACELMHIHFMDHVIVTDGQYYSFHEVGKC